VRVKGISMNKRAVRLAKVATLAAIPFAIVWATSTPPVGRSGAPGDTTCASCHGGAGSASVVLASTSGLVNYTPGTSKHFTVTVSGSGGKAGLEITARPASNLSGGVAGTLVAGTGTQVLCKVGTTCAAGNPQYIRSLAATVTPATFDFDWTAPSGTEDVTLYVAAAVGYSGSTYTGTYLLKAGAAPPPALSVTPTNLSFSYQIGGAAPATQTLAITGAATTYTAVASGGTWLSVTPASGGTSGSAGVSVNTAGLAAGSYSGSVAITAAGSTSSPMTVPVTLNVTAATPVLTVSPASLSFAYQIGGTAPSAQALTIGGAATSYTVAASGGTWLSVTPASGGTSGSANVSVNTAGVAAGSYSGSITITAAGSSGSPKAIPVSLTVTPPTPVLTVSPGSLSFAYQIGGTAPAAQTVSFSGAATSYTVAASGGTWLSVTPASGGTSGSASVSVNTAGLAAGSYSGSVAVAAAGSSGSPTTVPVTLSVTATAPTLTVSPASLAFAYQIGGTAPVAQTLSINGAATAYTVASSGGTWLSVSPVSGGTSGSVGVSVNTAGMTAGSYSGSVTVTAAGSTGSPKTVPVTLSVTPAAPILTVSPASLTFAYQIGGTAPTAQTLTLGGVSGTVTAAASGGAWLSASPSSGSVGVSVNTAGMTAGTYSGTVTVTASGSTGSPKTVPVTFNVTVAAPTLTVSPASLSFAYQLGGTAPVAQTLNISGVTSTLTAAASGGTWLSVSLVSGSASVSVNTAGLAAGSYSGSVTITAAGSTGSPKTVPVTFSVTAAAPTLTVSPASLSFSYRIGSDTPGSRTLTIAGASATFTAAASGGAWLSVSPASGGTSGSVRVSVRTSGLAAGTYSGTVTITASGSTGSPNTVPVTLTVTANPVLTVSPASLTFAYQVGTAAPAAQTLTIGGVSSTFTAAASGGAWLSVNPASGGTTSATVQVNTAGLAAGSYSGTVTITASRSSGSPIAVPVTLTVAPPAMTVSPASLSFAYQIGTNPPAPQTLTIGGVASTFAATASGGPWLSVSTGSASANVSVSTAGLAPGTYTGLVTVTAAGSSGNPLAVPVVFTVTPGILTVSPATLSFTYRMGDPAPAVQKIVIDGAPISYAIANSSGAWLTLSPGRGTGPGAINVSLNTAGMVPGVYSATVTISAPYAVNPVQTVTVNLTLLEPPPQLLITPATVSLTCAPGNQGPIPYVVAVASSGKPLTYTAAASGGSWLSVAPASGATSGAIFVSVNPTGLTDGATYTASIAIIPGNPESKTQVIPVTLAVSGTGTSSCPVTGSQGGR
jgi:hypothetical protein